MASTGLNFFHVPPTDFWFEARRYVHYRPYQGIEPITFNVPPSDDYMDIKEAKLLIEVRLKNSATGHAGHLRWNQHQKHLDCQQFCSHSV